ncbi:MAG: succinyldiaminopimelate transaminase, partial [Cellvibrionales bacterium]|nr:succinyldiaminopimelate transaminase [Cellvibrionales bacterium]
MNPQLERLHDYPFTKLARLLEQVSLQSEQSPIALTIGEPQHPSPQVAIDALQEQLAYLNQYPSTQGSDALREAIAAWLCRRYGLASATLDPASMVLPVVGSREALFAIAQTVVNNSTSSQPPLVIIPSPFYQIYEGAAIMAGAEPLYLPCSKDYDFLPDLDAITHAQWQRCQLIYICNPSNPTGAV